MKVGGGSVDRMALVCDLVVGRRIVRMGRSS